MLLPFPFTTLLPIQLPQHKATAFTPNTARPASRRQGAGIDGHARASTVRARFTLFYYFAEVARPRYS